MYLCHVIDDLLVSRCCIKVSEESEMARFWVNYKDSIDMDYKYDVFISYSRKDTDVADRICRAFDEEGISYFIDRQGIGGGMEFPAVLAKAIKESVVFLFLASKNSYESKFTQSEIVYAFNKKQKQDIIPYIIDGSTMPDELEFTFSAINWRQMDRHPIDTTLVDDVLYRLGRQRTNTERNGLTEFLENNNKREEVNSNSRFFKKCFVNFRFSGKTLAWIVLAYSIVMFLIMSILSRNFIQAHSTTIENIIIPSIMIFLISTIVGVIRPASMALGDRKDVLRFYLSSAVILFVSMFFVVGSNNG